MARIKLFVGTEKGAFRLESDEGRERWAVTGPLLKGWDVLNLVLDERTEPTLYAAVGHYVYGPTIRISQDLGETWQEVEHGPSYADDGGDASRKLQNVWDVVPGRQDEPDTLYAGVADAGLFATHDRGQHWDEIEGLTNHASRDEWEPGAGGLCLHTILLHPENKDRLWVGISSVGVFRSDDGGATWRTKNEGLDTAIDGKTHKDIGTCIHRVVIDPRNPDRLFQQNHKGVYRTEDGGDTWTRIEDGLPGTFGFPMVMDSRDSDTLYIVPQESDEYRFAKDGDLAVYKTTDAGGSWSPLRNGLPSQSYVGVLRHAMAVDTCDPTGIYFGTTGGQLFQSRDAGHSWQPLPCVLPRIKSVTATLTHGG